ncbi:MAG: UDP-N-acetylmuramoyl-L-alanine--D-glutamate ligase [Candidatus Ancillula sp.]|jgi:UDP-N-acetylmuramoylalanine--D-glutamate ligase|nr:UDP-N-acetylmuramoyl-L-alanine--D-glutamate ligase [Candidatus Ancillula sp.]
MSQYAIIGYGAEGKAAYEYFSAKVGKDNVQIFDDSSPDLPSISQLPSLVKKGTTLVRSPGISLHNPPLEHLPKGANITSGTNEFFSKCPAPIIGVTGTKGKGTTSSMIASILDGIGYRVHLLGNIGVPALKVLPDIEPEDVVVYELSSFQLWDLNFSPQIAVLTVLEPDHLDVHHSYREYLDAKKNIFNHQTRTDYLVYNGDDEQVTAEVKSGVAHHVVYPQEYANSLDRATPLPGKHNVDNAGLAVLAVQSFLHSLQHVDDMSTSDPDYTDNVADAKCVSGKSVDLPHFTATQEVHVRDALRMFTGLDHRLKLVGSVNGVHYYDDSIATTPGSAVAAIKSFDAPKVLILGGKDKGGDYTTLGKELDAHRVETVIMYGENRDTIHGALEGVTSAKLMVLDAKSMQEIVLVAEAESKSGDVVILSPAAASFDMFKNYQERGSEFIAAVQGLEGFRPLDDADVIHSEVANNPIRIGIFDSGRGGEFVATSLKSLRPNDTFQVVNDSENVPYGDKTPKQIYELTKQAIKPLLGEVDVLAIACNTATAYAIDGLRSDYPDVRFVGFEPMIKPASLNSSTGNIAVLATPATLKSERYQKLKDKWASDYNVFEPDCSTWARRIEDGVFGRSDIAGLDTLVRAEEIDQVILACTHYLGVKEMLQHTLPPQVNILEPIEAISRQISRIAT